MKMVAGLGNPGARYERTRHNVGFRVADRLAEAGGARFGPGPAEALVARREAGDERVVLVKPQTWMNLSGRAVAPLARWYRIEADALLVVCDDLALPEGRLRFRRGGSDGGHKGLASVLEAMGTRDVARLRVGVGAPAGAAEDWVLAPFAAAEEERFRAAEARAAEAVETWIREGIEACMNRYNAAPDPEGS
ncbi:MAG: aminoacyl-tRNA hydrolase [Planctomycetes bacterium]|jgi:PTH1 family peptidyl-tRNA hydrolase|nr:aminoacyl-tRNA hydrolase [Planctomycetota bacterium]